MNREIKFRGLRLDGKGWVYGSLIWSNAKTDRCYIIGWNGAKFQVIPESVGQFTGLKDKNGVDIYEGDIVEYITTVKMDSEGRRFTYKGVIDFWLGQIGNGWRYKSGRYTMMIKFSHTYNMEVIGNIHQNTELI